MVIRPEYSLEELMLKLKLQYFGYLMRRTDTWKIPWCWESLKAGEGDYRGWADWMASLTQWTWVWVNSGSWWWTWRPGMLQSMGWQRAGHYWVTELNWTEPAYWNSWKVIEAKRSLFPVIKKWRTQKGFGPMRPKGPAWFQLGTCFEKLTIYKWES